MPKLVNRLSAKSIDAKKSPGLYADGNGLYLQVSPTGSKSWVLRYTIAKRTREMGLGSFRGVTLEQAREKAKEQRTVIANRGDPIEARRQVLLAKQLDDAKRKTFDDCAAGYIKAHRAGWKSAKHASQWENTLRDYVSPIFGNLPVQDVDVALVLKAIEPLWDTKTETASRVRNRIELVLDWAKARKYRTGENPARWRGHLDKLLLKRSKIAPIKHHEALPFSEASAFLETLRTRTGVSPKALEFIIVTAVRVSEAVNATWDEFDLNTGVWTIPERRMKAKKAHRVPLSAEAMKVLASMQELRQRGNFVFPGWRLGRALTGAAVLKVLRDMGHRTLTVHGFRSTFRDWCADQTNYPRDVCEMALAHTIKDKSEEAYRRGDMLAKRARLMADWAKYLSTRREASVTPIRSRKAK